LLRLALKGLSATNTKASDEKNIRDLHCFRILRRKDWQSFTGVSGQRIGPNFKGEADCLTTFKMGPIGCPETLLTTNLRCVISQISEDIIYTMTEA
jgi:hypothetical protein